MSETVNAKIASTMLGYEDHGILTFWLYLDYGGGGQGFGGWALDGRPVQRGSGEGRVPTDAAGAIIASLLTTLEVASWEKLPGQIVRVRAEHTKVEAIGHALKDKWCVPADIFARLRGVSV